jgi:F0F1-type ATP synthase delta subunit
MSPVAVAFVLRGEVMLDTELLRLVLVVLVAHVVVLGGVVLLVRWFLLASARQAVARVRAVEQEVRQREEGLRRDIEEHEREMAERKATTEREIESLQDDAKREAAHFKERAMADAKRDAQKILDQAQANEKKMRDQIARDMEEKAVAYGGKIFHLVFSDVLNAELNALFTSELIDAFNEIEAGTVTVDTPAAHITTSHPLPDAVRERLAAVLREKFHGEATLEESVDASLLAGVSLKMGSLEIDGSLLNRYRDAVHEVQKEVHHGE